MSNEDSSHEVDQISYYVNLALSLSPTLDKRYHLPFDTWLNQFEYVADIIQVPENKMVELFENMVDDALHKRIKQQFSDTNISELSYENIIDHYVRCFYNRKEVLFHRKRFEARKQYEKETIEKYSIHLQKLHNKCNFPLYMEVILCEQFKSGIRSNDIKNRLPISPFIAYAEIVGKAIALEKEIVMTDFINLALSKINTYDSSTESEFHVWLNKFEYIADMIEVPDELMLEFFEKMVDDGIPTNVKNSYPILCLLSLTYEDTIPYYLKYFSPLDVDLHMKRFMCRNQYENEAIDKYAKHLLKLSNKCSNANNQNEMLFKKFLNGLRDEYMRNYLKQFSGLTFDEMVEKAISFSKEHKINSYVNEALKMINIYNSNFADHFFSWINRFEYIANKIEIPDDIMGKFFIKMIHDDVHTLVQNNYPNINFSKISCNDIINYYSNYFSEHNPYLLYKKRFQYRLQYEDESLESLMITLKILLKKWNYEYCDEKKLCKKFISAVSSYELSKYLLENPSSLPDELVAKAIEFERTKDILPYTRQALSMIHTYNQEREGEFYIWLNKFEYVAEMIEVPDEKMVKFFNKMVDQNVHTSVMQSLPSINFSELPYEETVNHYLRYFLPYEVDLHIKRFKCRNQYKNETIAKYYNNLKKIYDKCHHVDRYRENFTEKFVNGIIDDDMKFCLNKTSDLTFDVVVSNDINMEEKYFPKSNE